MPVPITRRSLVGAAPLLLGICRPSMAETSRAVWRVGAFTIIRWEDGRFPLEPSMIPGAVSADGRALLDQAGLSPNGPSPEPVNAFLVRRGERYWLLDAGCGSVFGPGFDRVTGSLAATGVRPDQIETIWLTHLHADHAGGLLTPERRARFPNAELVVQEREAAFWFDDGARANASAALGPMFDTARSVLAVYGHRLRRVAGEAELASGVYALPLPGHTPGHMGILVADGAEQLLIWGDVIHSRLLQMPHPDWTVIWDADPAQAVATRRGILDRAVSEGLDVAGMHLSVRGRIARSGSGYRLT